MKKIASLCVLAAAVSAQAGVINGSFENPAINSPGVFTQSVPIPGWTGLTGVWRLPSGGQFNIVAPDGLNIGYGNGPGAAQQLSDTVQVGQQTASLMAGRRGDGFASSFTFRMIAGGTIQANGLVTGGTVLAEQFFNIASVSANSFTPMAISYTAAQGDPLLGQQITLAMVKGNGSQMNFDMVEFNAVPEPATMLIGLGLIPLLRRRRKA